MQLFSSAITVALILQNLCESAAPGNNASFYNPKMKAIVEKAVKQNLTTFEYKPESKVLNANNQKSQLPGNNDLRQFQNDFLLYQSGLVNVPTKSKISEYRCGYQDITDGDKLHGLQKLQLWKKRPLLWAISSLPLFLTKSETREACNEAFKKWRSVAEMDFIETNNASRADILILFATLPNSFLNVAATSSAPLNSWIILNKNLLWGYRNRIPGGISLFHTLLHEIGHALGLQHNFYRESIMYPILKPAVVSNGFLDEVPNVDTLSLRKLYGFAKINEKSAAGPQTFIKCPKQIDSVIRVTPYEWMVFHGSKVYQVKGRRFVDNGRKIQDVFPRAPGFVNATVTSGNLVLLFVERNIYGYEYDGVTFSEAPGFPRELHERVLFYPQAAFPLSNRSVILLSGNVFATYDVFDNVPTFLNDKTRYFPNLPDGLRSGVLQGSNDRYWMFDEKTVSDYDMQIKQVYQVASITDFFKCR